jgi:hypothetical protein
MIPRSLDNAEAVVRVLLRKRELNFIMEVLL